MMEEEEGWRGGPVWRVDGYRLGPAGDYWRSGGGADDDRQPGDQQQRQRQQQQAGAGAGAAGAASTTTMGSHARRGPERASALTGCRAHWEAKPPC